MVHAYSLVHDDLPAMDDDDLRRGRATVHRAFDEATAVLAGDALLTLAFETLALAGLKAERRARLVLELARASGWAGMVGGQALDLEAEGERLSLPALLGIHRRKTGALLMASVRMGGLSAGASPRRMDALTAYGRAVGLAFQIQDDILDVTGSEAKMGKRLRKDAPSGKATFPSLLGLARSRARAQALAAEAVRALKPLGSRAEPLALLARFIVSRER
jgi:farnesyl diphosphate synthase/geranylgeranyl diphosphate synthase type II